MNYGKVYLINGLDLLKLIIIQPPLISPSDFLLHSFSLATSVTLFPQLDSPYVPKALF